MFIETASGLVNFGYPGEIFSEVSDIYTTA
jgi:hypothetical protein